MSLGVRLIKEELLQHIFTPTHTHMHACMHTLFSTYMKHAKFNESQAFSSEEGGITSD